MALPTAGQLSFNQINVELGNASASQASMRAMSIDAGKTTNNASVSAFYGYSAGDSILLSWGTTTPYGAGEHRVATHSGHTSPQIITINFNYSVSYTSDYMYLYTSYNSTGTWSLAATIPKSGSGSFSRTSVAYNGIVRVRWSTNATFFIGASISFNGGTVTSGSGTVSGTAAWNFNP